MAKRDPLTEQRRASFQAWCERLGLKHDNGRWNLAAASQRLGLAYQQTSNLLNGHGSFGATLAREIEHAQKLPHGFFDGGDQEEFADVPRVDVRLAAGNGSVDGLEEVLGHLKFTRTFLRACGINAPEYARVVDVRGHSMDPTIRDGAVLLVSLRNTEPREGDIYAISKPSDGLVVKRLHRTPDGWLARSDNREYAADDFMVGPGNPGNIIGRAVWVGTKL